MSDVLKLFPLALLLLVSTGGCAHMEPPRGGPEDRTPPGILATNPADEAIVPGFDQPVLFDFDERITQQGITDAVSVSPRTSRVEIRHGRSAIRVSLREGWQPGVIYHVTVSPDVRDLFGNALAGPYQLVFSTGPEIPDTRLTGTLVDRITGRRTVDARVEAIRTVDSLVYVAVTDSVGAFVIDQFPAGEYQVRAFPDIDNDRTLDSYESRDSAFVTVEEANPIEVTLRLLAPDSTPPVIESVTVDSAEVRIEFDDYLDPDQALDVGQVGILHPATGELEITSIAVAPAASTAGTPPPDAAAALPSRWLLVELAEGVQIVPEVEYRITAREIENVNGLAGASETTLEIDPPPDPP